MLCRSEFRKFDLEDAEAAANYIGALCRRNACVGCGDSIKMPLEVKCGICKIRGSPVPEPSAAVRKAVYEARIDAMALVPKEIPVMTLLKGRVKITLRPRINLYEVKVDDVKLPRSHKGMPRCSFNDVADAVAWVNAELVSCDRCSEAVENYIRRGPWKFCLDCRKQAGRLIVSRAKAALASPTTILGKSRLMREAESMIAE